MKLKLSKTLFLILMLCATGMTQAAPTSEPTYKPYILASVAPAQVKEKLTAEGFEVLGEYEPYKGANVIVITSDSLKNAAAQSDFGGYGAVQRVAIAGDEVSYTNPVYWANGYRMATDLNDIAAALKKALGNNGEFGSKKGKTKKELRKYHYAPFMPYFTDPIELAKHGTHKAAVEKVETALKKEGNGTMFVYRVDIPNKDETLFGMGILGDHDGADRVIMTMLNKYTTDKAPKHLAYMPYEILVSGTNAYLLHGKFRIALSFPDLSMMQFMKIRKAPDGIEKTAKAAAK
jgi:hypothetical protein